MAQAMMNEKARVVPRHNIRKLCKDEIFSETEKQKRRLFEYLIQKRLGDSMAHLEKPILTEYEPYSDDSDPASVLLPEDNDPVETDGTTYFEKPITDRWIHAEINLPQGESMQNAKVIGRATDQYGNVIETYGGEIKEYSANVIA